MLVMIVYASIYFYPLSFGGMVLSGLTLNVRKMVGIGSIGFKVVLLIKAQIKFTAMVYS